MPALFSGPILSGEKTTRQHVIGGTQSFTQAKYARHISPPFFDFQDFRYADNPVCHRLDGCQDIGEEHIESWGMAKVTQADCFTETDPIFE